MICYDRNLDFLLRRAFFLINFDDICSMHLIKMLLIFTK